MQNTFSTLTREAYNIYKEHYKPLIIASLIGTIVTYLIFLILAAIGFSFLGMNMSMNMMMQPESMGSLGMNFIPLLLFIIIAFVVILMISTIVQIINLSTIKHVLHKENTDIKSMISAIKHFFMPSIKLSLAIFIRIVRPIIIICIAYAIFYFIAVYGGLIDNISIMSTISSLVMILTFFGMGLYILYICVKYAFASGYMIEKDASVADSMQFSKSKSLKYAFTLLAIGVVVTLIARIFSYLISYILPFIMTETVVSMILDVVFLTPFICVVYMLMTRHLIALDTVDTSDTSLESPQEEIIEDIK